jgi:hypothetical protein
MTAREMLKVLQRTPEKFLDDEVAIVDSYNGNVYTGVSLVPASTSKKEDGDTLFRKGTRVIVIP